jgi:nicotinate-nucleotide adenylyltransferase
MSLTNFIKNKCLHDSEEIIFFGGSFNPWHNGHSSCLSLTPNETPVVIIPDHNPFKELVDSSLASTTLDEIQSILDTFERDFFLFDEFFLKNEKNPTSYWVKELKKNYPNLRISLLIGFDSFISIDRWIDSANLLPNLESLFVVDRLNDEQVKNNQIKNLRKFKSLKLIFLGEHDYEDLSSSSIRKKFDKEK